MASLSFSRADTASDADLRGFLRDHSSEGSIALCLEREPSYFDALEVEGVTNDVVLMTSDSEVAGIATRSEKPCYVNGCSEPISVGYLSNLRIAPVHRGTTALARGYRFLRDLHRLGSSSLYLTTIMADNVRAKRSLTSGRAGLPSYEPFGDYETYILRAGDYENICRPGVEIDVRPAVNADVDEIVKFLGKHGPSRQFFPAYTAADLLSEQGLLRGLRVGDILVAREGPQIVGTTALWNQAAFRQWSIVGYARSIRLLRPFFNTYAAFRSYPSLPRVGSRPSYRIVSLVCVQDDRDDVFRALMSRIQQQILLLEDRPYIFVGFHERDPLRKLVQDLPHFVFRSTLHVVHWEDGASDFCELRDMVPYLELGAL